MVDYYPGYITIGGIVTPKQLYDIIKQVDVEFDIDDCIMIEDEHTEYGRFEQLEKYLREEEIPYDRHSSGYYEYPPEEVYYRPGMEEPAVFVTDNGGKMVYADTISTALDEWMERHETLDIDLLFCGLVNELRHIIGDDIENLPKLEIRGKVKEVS